MKTNTPRYTVRNSSLFDARPYNAQNMAIHLGKLIANPRARRFASNQPAQLTFALAQGVTPETVASKLAEMLDGRTPFIDAIQTATKSKGFRLSDVSFVRNPITGYWVASCVYRNQRFHSAGDTKQGARQALREQVRDFLRETVTPQ